MNNKDAITKIAHETLSKTGLAEKGWVFVITSRGMHKSFGTCHYGLREVALHPVHLENASYESCLDTLMHEIAHALTPGDGHGTKWRRAARMLGANPRATSSCTSMDEAIKAKSKYQLCAKMDDGTIIRTRTFQQRRSKLDGKWLRNRPETKNKLFWDAI